MANKNFTWPSLHDTLKRMRAIQWGEVALLLVNLLAMEDNVPSEVSLKFHLV
jgi:hypothetical protein